MIDKNTESWSPPFPIPPSPKAGFAIPWMSLYKEKMSWQMRVQWANVWKPVVSQQWRGLEITQHLWGSTAEGVDFLAEPLFARFTATVPADESGVILYCNEPDAQYTTVKDPDWGVQAAMSPWRAACLYKQLITRYPNAMVTTPQVTHLRRGLTWMAEWYKIVKRSGLRMPNYLGIHTYSKDNYPDRVVSEAQALSTLYGGPKKYIVSEWAQWDADGVRRYLEFFEQDTDCTRHYYYAPFVGPEGENADISLFTASGSLSMRGREWQAVLYELYPYEVPPPGVVSKEDS